MSLKSIINLAFSIGGKRFSNQAEIDSEAVREREVTLGPAKAGTLTTRTDGNTGTLTMASAGHGIATGNKIAIFYAGGVFFTTAGTVSGTSVPFDLDLLAGQPALPLVNAAVTVMVLDSNALAFDPALVTVLAVGGTGPGIVGFWNGTALVYAYTSLTGTKWGRGWWSGNGATNPLAGTSPTHVYFAHGDPVNSYTFTVSLAYN